MTRRCVVVGDALLDLDLVGTADAARARRARCRSSTSRSSGASARAAPGWPRCSPPPRRPRGRAGRPPLADDEAADRLRALLERPGRGWSAIPADRRHAGQEAGARRRRSSLVRLDSGDAPAAGARTAAGRRRAEAIRVGRARCWSPTTAAATPRRRVRARWPRAGGAAGLGPAPARRRAGARRALVTPNGAEATRRRPRRLPTRRATRWPPSVPARRRCPALGRGRGRRSPSARAARCSPTASGAPLVVPAAPVGRRRPVRRRRLLRRGRRAGAGRRRGARRGGGTAPSAAASAFVGARRGRRPGTAGAPVARQAAGRRRRRRGRGRLLRAGPGGAAARSWPPAAASTCCTPGTSPRCGRPAALGDCLVVCLNSDDSVRRLKGPSRPLVTGGRPGPGAAGAGVRRRRRRLRRGHPRRGARAGCGPTSGPRAATTPAPTCPRPRCCGGGAARPSCCPTSTAARPPPWSSAPGCDEGPRGPPYRRWCCGRWGWGTCSPACRRSAASARRCPTTGWCWPPPRRSSRSRR